MGPAKLIGPAMCCHILKANGSVLQRSIIGPLSPMELANEDTKRDTFKTLHSRDLNKQERDEVLESHLFLKEKRDKSIKGQMVAGGNKQSGTIEKLDASSSTVASESVLLTAVIDAKEKRHVAVIDIPNALQSSTKKRSGMLQ